MEQMTVLVLEAVLKIHHMVVEVFNGHGCLDGRVFNGQCVIMWWRVGYAITPEKIRKIGDFTWGDEEYRRVAELMEWMIG